MRSPIMYNLFPRLVGHMQQWLEHTERARTMGFDWIFVNPLQYPGFSGSLYAVKEYYRLNPMFVPPGTEDELAALRRAIEAMHEQGLRVAMDLVVNHTAKDSPLVDEHPEWYKLDKRGRVVSPSAIDPADANNVTVWGDLAEIDNEGSSDRDGLWGFWAKVVADYVKLGFDGFRCDAAYKVPSALWSLLIDTASTVDPDVVFFAETLGCRLGEMRQLKDAGFDYLFNSSKWWGFDERWALDQHAEFGQIAPSLAFPESHDTPRLMEESGGLVQVQKQRYAFAATFSAGLMMPVGYEYGFRKRLNVVETTPADWEHTDVDLTAFIKKVNGLKRTIPTLGIEGKWQVMTSLGGATLALTKTDAELKQPVLVLINKDWHAAQPCQLPPLERVLAGPGELQRLFTDAPPEPLAPTNTVRLAPAEVALVLPKRRS